MTYTFLLFFLHDLFLYFQVLSRDSVGSLKPFYRVINFIAIVVTFTYVIVLFIIMPWYIVLITILLLQFLIGFLYGVFRAFSFFRLIVLLGLIATPILSVLMVLRLLNLLNYI